MNLKLDVRPIEQVDADTLVVLGFEGEDPEGGLRAVNDATGGWIQEIIRSREFTGKSLETAMLHRPQGLKARRVLAIGAGKREKFSTAELRKVAGAALRFLKPKSAATIALVLEAGASGDQVAACAEGALLGDFEPDYYKTEKKDAKAVDEFAVVVPGASGSLESAVAQARIVAEAQNFARRLVNEPGNRMNPAVLASRAHEIASEFGLECEVLDRERMRELGMGALLGVAQGSDQPPALIVLRYRPLEDRGSGTHLALVGKGVTFDTGGISIKPADGMEKMKYDMAGGAAVLGAMRALAQLKPAIPVTALIPAVENMPGGNAQRPGDIVTTLAGKTVEVLNTDAEGRLILADALAYARRLGCTHLVDAATLTGAIVVALGHYNIGAFSNNEEFLGRVMAASRLAGEKMWHMPLDDDYKEYLKSAFADLPNIGGRHGGAVTAAMFLREFVESTPWVHLDIAGTAWLDEARPFLAKGPSGVPVRTLVRLAMEWKG